MSAAGRVDRLRAAASGLIQQILFPLEDADEQPPGHFRNTPLISAIAITGTNRQNSRKHVKNRPKLPTSVAISIDVVGLYDAQLDGRKSRSSELTMMMNRSNHMPTLMKSEMTNTTSSVRRTRANQNSWGTSTLHPTMIQ